MRLDILRRKPFSFRAFVVCFLTSIILEAVPAMAGTPTMPFTVSTLGGPTPLAVNFTAPNTNSYGNTVIQWFWNFGDGATSFAQNPTHVYTNNGTFLPTLQGFTTNFTAVTGVGPSVTVGPITNLVANGGFESGSFSGWTLSSNFSLNFVTSNTNYVFSGSFGAQLGPKGAVESISQNMATTPGTTYLLSYWLNSSVTNAITNEFITSIGGVTVFNQTNVPAYPPPGWSNAVFGFTATGTNTVLQFGFRDDPAYFGLDAVDCEAITVLPATQTVECGGTATFTLQSNNFPAISYQWYIGIPAGTNAIPGATNYFLTITNVSSSPTSTPTNYTVVVSNASGSFTSSVVALVVEDSTPPVITLNGSNPMQVLINSGFTDPGATALDACAGVVGVTNSGFVNTNVIGTYFINYTASDGVNVANVTRTVQVVPRTYDYLVMNTTNVLGYWPFTASSGPNSVVNGYTGNFLGSAFVLGAGSGPAFFNTTTNSSVSLNGASGTIPTSLTGSLTNNEGSIVGWFNLAALPGGAPGHKFYIAGEFDTNNDFSLDINTNNQIEASVSGSPLFTTVAPTPLTPSDVGLWHFVGMTFISSQFCNIYLDGVLVASNVNSGNHNPAGSNTFTMGASSTGPFGPDVFDGLLSDVAVFNRSLSAAEIATFYAAATQPVAITISSPSNGSAFFTNQSITFSATANAVNGLASLVLLTNSIPIATNTSSTNLSVVLSNLPPGSYALTAVATDDTGLVVTSAVTHVTVNVPGTSLIDFDLPDASGGPVTGAALSNYLAGYGVTLAGVTPGTTVAIQQAQNVSSGQTAAFSPPNILTQTGTNGQVSYTFLFNTPYNAVSWERTAIVASGGGAVGPEWTAYAFDTNGNELSQVGESQTFSPTTIPAKQFTLAASNITSITFTANNRLSPFDNLPLDSMLLSSNALGPVPTIVLTPSGISSGEPGQITLNATAFEGGGAISSISFFDNQNPIGIPSTVIAGTNATSAITVTSLAPGTNVFYATATDTNGLTTSSTNVTLVVTPVAGVSVINFDDPTFLNTTVGAVGGTNLSNYLANFGVTITNVTIGTSLEAINQNNFSGNELPLPTSLPNLFTQVGSSQPVTFSLAFATNLQSFTFSRSALLTNGASGISHPSWTASALDASGNVLESVSEPVLFSTNDIPSQTFTLYGANIASVKFSSDSRQTAAFSAILLDDLVLNANAAANPLSITLNNPGGSLTAPATLPLGVSASDGLTNIVLVNYYNGPTLIGTATNPPFSFSASNFLNGNFNLTATMVDAAGYALPSAIVPITVAPGGVGVPLVINFDSLNTTNGPVTGTNLATYLATNQGLTIGTNSSNTVVGVENESDAGGGNGGFVSLTSLPNLLTQLGTNGPVSFTVNFSNFLTQFSFTRPDLVPNPSVTHPAWQATVFDPLGNVLSTVAEGRITSLTNVPAATYTLGGGSIASVRFDSFGTGFETFNAALLDDFIVTEGNASNLPPAVAITNPVPGELFVSNAAVTISAATAAASGTVTGVGFYYNGTNLAGSATASPYTISWNAPSNSSFVLTAIITNSGGLTSTSAPVPITVGAGFAIITPPASATIALGGSNVFTVVAAGTNVTYQWQTNGTPIPGATLPSFTVSNATLANAGSYTVVATSFGLSITSQPPALLTVLPPPSISSVLQSPSNVNIGDTVVLSVTATDAVPFYYQWDLNGSPIPGATNSSFTISNAQPINSGSYQVQVANAAAVTNSPVFNVQVNLGNIFAPTNNTTFASAIAIAPLIGPVAGINSNSPVVPGPGEPTSVIAGKPAGRFLWYRWTANFTGVVSLTTQGSSFDTLMAVFTGSVATNLTLVTQDDDSGGYFTSLVNFNCLQGVTYYIAVAGYKGAAGTVVLGLPSGTAYRVLDPTSGASVPFITQQPSNQVVNVGTTVVLSVTASNANSYQWYFAGAPVVGLPAMTISSTNSALSTNILTISNFPAGAVGNYYALAVNGVGAAQTATAAIEIALNTNAATTNVPNTLTVDKFGDAVDLTSTGAASRYRPEAAGGDTGNFVLSQSFSTVGATKEEGEPNHAGQPGGASYWYSYTAPASGVLQIDTRGSTFNTILAIYTGPGNSFSTLVNVGAAYTTNFVKAGQPVVLVSNVVVGTKYFIAIDGYLGASGAAHLNVVLNYPSNAINTNIPPATNNYASFSMSYPPNNFLTTSSNITIKGTVSGVAGAHPPLVSFVDATINSGPTGHAALTATNFAAVLAPGPGGVEEAVAQETVTWSSNVTLVPGPNIITVQSVAVAAGGIQDVTPAITRTVFLVPSLPNASVKSTLTLTKTGNGKITGLANNAVLEVNKVYTVTAVPIGNWLFTNWSSGTSLSNLAALPNGPTLSFTMASNLILQANFITNPFTAVAGTYNGLFSPVTGATQQSSGFITVTIPSSSRGSYSAKLMLDGGTYPFSGSFDLSGNAGKTISRSGKTSLTTALQINLTTPDDQITGGILDDESNGWVSQIQADRAVFNAKAPATNFNGRFTVILPPGPTAPTNDPGGYGYATLNNTLAGQVSILGKLGDGTSISQTVPVAKDGSVPVYNSLYGNKGVFLGWLNIVDNPSNTPAKSVFGANLAWMKSAVKSKSLYKAGFTNVGLTAFGTFYSAPASGGEALTLTNGTLILSNGDLSTPLVYSNLTVVHNKLVNNNPSNPPNPLSGTINPATGVLTVTFKATGASHSTTASGVVLQNNSVTNGAGWFLGTDQSGLFLLEQ